MSFTKSDIATFRRIVLNHYKTRGRHSLPWRTTHDPYRILVSEIMLQQTQVERVTPFYGNFLKKFPTVQVLAKAPLSAVLASWQGLGYNRRAKMLQQAAKQVVSEYGGTFPKDADTLQKLRGVGPYTARAVAAFAYNTDDIFIETNIRTAVMYHFFPKKKKVNDAEIRDVLTKTLSKGRAREWYSALMDYGSYLKRSGIRTNARVKGYAKQKKFDGSLRQARGAVLRTLIGGPRPSRFLTTLLGPEREVQMKVALAGLTKEGLIRLSGGKFSLPN
jgi:A/G-specific adenine glycosylase